MYRFDSKLVRLKVPELGENDALILSFRFQTGSIKSGLDDHHHDYFYNGFDSKLVRLKVQWIAAAHPVDEKFRFQTGSIKRKHQLRP